MYHHFSQGHSFKLLPTWFLNDSVAGGGNLLSLGLIRVLVITEVAEQTHAKPIKHYPLLHFQLIYSSSFYICLPLSPPPPTPYLSITARHSFLQVNLLPRRRRNPVGPEPNGSGAWCQSIMSSRASGAARMARVAPEGKTPHILVFRDYVYNNV